MTCWAAQCVLRTQDKNGDKRIMKKLLSIVVLTFVALCAWLVVDLLRHGDCALHGRCILLQQTVPTATAKPKTTVTPPQARSQPTLSANPSSYSAQDAEHKIIWLGSSEKDTGFKFELELTTKGAAVHRAIFNEYDQREAAMDPPQKLILLAPALTRGGVQVFPFANKQLVLVEQRLQIRLHQLDWQLAPIERDRAGGETARFTASVTDQDGTPFLEVVKTYRVQPDSYLFECDISVSNLSDSNQTVRMGMVGPTGLKKEAFRGDMRKVVAAFRNERGGVDAERVEVKHLKKANGRKQIDSPSGNADSLLWTASVNKYFAAIVVPVPGTDGSVGLRNAGTAVFYNPDGDLKKDSGTETVGFDLETSDTLLAPVGQAGSTKTHRFQIYLGPKDKGLFDRNEQFRELGFVETIDFMSCCCPAGIINPLTFGILWFMKFLYGWIPNYGLVIIILVALVRLALHPVTKKSQISMHKMSKLAPRAEEIKKKYGNSKTEMNKQMMALYKEQGASPIMGFLPMMLQMPIWIALWSAVNASVDLRGEGMLPFWITDLSMPDALFPLGIWLPFGLAPIESFNLLPLLMGVAFYAQQKMMPAQAAAAANPQMAQQQKMMQIMMPILFPLMLYTVPSGVKLYIMTSTFAGVIEQKIIRKHPKEKEEAEAVGLVAVTSKTGGKVKKKKPKPLYKK